MSATLTAEVKQELKSIKCEFCGLKVEANNVEDHICISDDPLLNPAPEIEEVWVDEDSQADEPTEKKKREYRIKQGEKKWLRCEEREFKTTSKWLLNRHLRSNQTKRIKLKTKTGILLWLQCEKCGFKCIGHTELDNEKSGKRFKCETCKAQPDMVETIIEDETEKKKKTKQKIEKKVKQGELI